MTEQTTGIVLHRLKYSDTSIIAHIYTRKYGRQAYLIYGSKAKNKSHKNNIIQPLAILDMQVYHNEKKNLQKIKEFALHKANSEISTDFIKNSIAFFIAEFLYKTLKENEPDDDLYQFTEHSVQILDSLTESAANFHLVFLIRLARFMGIEPNIDTNANKQIFDLLDGKFRLSRPNHEHYTDALIGDKLKIINNLTLSKSHNIRLSKSERSRILHTLIDYYNLHTDRPGKLKSLDVLQSMFA